MVAGSIPAEGKFFIFIFLYFYLGHSFRATHRPRPLPSPYPSRPAALRSTLYAPPLYALRSALRPLMSSAPPSALAMLPDPGRLRYKSLACNALIP